MDVCQSEKVSGKLSTAETTRKPLVSADHKNEATRRSQIREVSSRYRSPTPSSPSDPKRSPSPIVSRKLSTSTVSVPPRAISAERKRPSAPSSPRSQTPSTPVRDTNAEMLLTSRKTINNKMPESLWPSTMRSLGSSFQSDSSSLISKREKSILHMPSDHTLRPPSNAACHDESSPLQKHTPERKRSPLKGKNSADQLENSKPVDSLTSRQLDQHRWPSRSSGKTFTALNKSEIIDKMDKTSILANPRLIKPSLRRLSVDGAIKSDITDKMDKTSVLSPSGSAKPSPRRLSVDWTIKSNATDLMDKASVLYDSGMVIPSPRKLSAEGTIKSNAADQMDKASILSESGTIKPSPRRLSLDGAIRTNTADQMDKSSVLSESGMIKLSPRRLSLDGAIKSNTADQMDTASVLSNSGMLKLSPRRISLDGAIKSDIIDNMDKTSTLSHSGSVKPSPRRLSMDATLKSDGRDQTDKTSVLSDSGTVKPSARRLSLDGTVKSDTTGQMDKTSVSSDFGTTKPSLRRLSLDGTVKSDATGQMDKNSVSSDFGTIKPSLRRLSLGGAIKSDTSDKMDKTSFSSDSGTVTPSPRKLSMDGAIKSYTTDKMDKTSFLSDSRSGISSPRKFSLDATSKPIKKSATDMLLKVSRDDNLKEMLYGRSIDDGLPRIQKPSSSSSSNRASLISGAARTPSSPTAGSRLPLLSVSRGVSPSRANAVIHSSRGTSPARVRPSSPSRQPQSSTSVLSFIADVKKGSTAANFEDVHHLRLLYNRHLQWRFANARAGTALRVQKVKTEKLLYGMWRMIADIWALMREKRSKFQQLGLKLKLSSVLHSQVTFLDEWASIERDHINSLTRFIQLLQASTILMPLARGGRGDINSIKAAIYSAAHVMQSMGSALCSVLPKVEDMNCLITELAELAAHEKAMLNECDLLLGTTDAYQVEEGYLRTLILQIKQGG